MIGNKTEKTAFGQISKDTTDSLPAIVVLVQKKQKKITTARSYQTSPENKNPMISLLF